MPSGGRKKLLHGFKVRMQESFPINFAVVDHGCPASRITATANVNGELGDCP
jgi:hypothetical protein